jgi:transposase
MEHSGSTKKFHLLLVKQVPGRKTDQKDSEWIADLLQHGMLKGSFIPPLQIRRLRDLTRTRAKIRQTMAAFANRIQKVLEDANIKLGSVASDVLGVSGRQMLKALIAGQQDPKQLAQMARGRLREKRKELELALDGHFTDHHRFQLELLLEFVSFCETQLSKLETEIQRLLAGVEQQPPSTDSSGTAAAPIPQSSTLQTALALWDSIPGVDQLTASTLLAEIGANMDQFPTAHSLACWAGLCPGNKESAGKRLSGKTTKGNVWLRRTLCQAAWAASRTKNTYLAAQYRRLIVRRGKKRTIVAVAHSMLLIAYHLLKRNCTYHDLGADYFDRKDSGRLKNRLVKRLIGLGYQVSLTPKCSGPTPEPA